MHLLRGFQQLCSCVGRFKIHSQFHKVRQRHRKRKGKKILKKKKLKIPGECSSPLTPALLLFRSSQDKAKHPKTLESFSPVYSQGTSVLFNFYLLIAYFKYQNDGYKNCSCFRKVTSMIVVFIIIISLFLTLFPLPLSILLN